MKQSKTLKAIISLMAIIAILSSVFSVSALADISPTEAKNGVVVVMRADGTGMGSGFAIGKPGKPVEYIVTNYHVVNNNDTGERFTTATVLFSMAAGSSMIANVIYNDAAKDISVIQLPEPTTQREALVLCPRKYVNLDDSFAALGYPGNQISDWPKYSTDDITITRGGIKKVDRLIERDVYMLDLTITHGNSGGPLINSAGEVVGINTFGVNEDSYAVVIDELLDNINRDKIPVAVHTDFPLIPVAIGGVILLVIIALVIILVVRGKKNTPPVPVEPPVPSRPAQPSHPAQPQPPVQPQKASARLIAIGGTLNAKKYSVSGTIKMGRDASKCSVVFPVNTQGVSGLHCEISFDGTVCYLKDLNSSYGTFTSEGQKLAPNSPHMLKSGDKFYLASPENTFEVRF